MASTPPACAAIRYRPFSKLGQAMEKELLRFGSASGCDSSPLDSFLNPLSLHLTRASKMLDASYTKWLTEQGVKIRKIQAGYVDEGWRGMLCTDALKAGKGRVWENGSQAGVLFLDSIKHRVSLQARFWWTYQKGLLSALGQPNALVPS